MRRASPPPTSSRAGASTAATAAWSSTSRPARPWPAGSRCRIRHGSTEGGCGWCSRAPASLAMSMSRPGGSSRFAFCRASPRRGIRRGARGDRRLAPAGEPHVRGAGAQRAASARASARSATGGGQPPTSNIEHRLVIEGVVEELYDVVALPGHQRPMAIGFRTRTRSGSWCGRRAARDASWRVDDLIGSLSNQARGDVKRRRHRRL